MRRGRRVRSLAIVALCVCLPLLFLTLAQIAGGAGAAGFWGAFGVLAAICMGGGILLVDARPALDHVLDLVDGAVHIHPQEEKRRGVDRLVRSSEIDDGYAPTPDRVVLQLANGARVDAEVESGRAHDVLDHLGVTLKQRKFSLPLRAMLGTFTRVLLAWMVTGIVTGPVLAVSHLVSPEMAMAFSQLLAVTAALVVGAWLRPRVVVGRDGVRIVGVLRPRFIPHSRIQSVRRWYQPNVQGVSGQPVGAVIQLDGPDGTVELPTFGQSEEQIESLLSHIEEGRAASASVDAPPLELLDRRERSVESWRKSLEALVLEEGGFRGAGLGQTELEDVLDDPKAALERRIGAALALRSRGGAARQRIRVAAGTTAEPHVRIALEAAGADEIDEQALARALEQPSHAHAPYDDPVDPG